MTEENPEKEAYMKRFENEKQEIRKLYKPFKNLKKPVKYKISPKQRGILAKNLGNTVQKHIDDFKDVLANCFTDSNSSVVAFDMEEIFNEILCILGIRIMKDMTFSLYVAASPHSPKPKETKVLIKHLIRWIKGMKDHPTILIHGFNKNEQEVIQELQKCGTVVNTQEEIREMICNGGDKNPLCVEKENLYHFQQKFGFKPIACTFIKHSKEFPGLPKRDLAMMWAKQAKIAVTRESNGKPPRTCGICGRPQDVFLYCLEDAITTLLAHAVFEGT